MGKGEFRTNQIDSDDKELKGLQDQGKMIFDCAECETTLLVLQLVTTAKTTKAKVLTRIAVRCEKCGGYSCVQQVPGQFYPGAPNDNMCFDVLEGDKCAPEADVLFKAWSK